MEYIEIGQEQLNDVATLYNALADLGKHYPDQKKGADAAMGLIERVLSLLGIGSAFVKLVS